MKKYRIRFDIIQYKLKMIQCKCKIIKYYFNKSYINKKNNTKQIYWSLYNTTGEDRLLQSLTCHTMNIPFNLIIFS